MSDVPRFLDIIDREIAAARAQRADAVGQCVRRVLLAADADSAFEELARAYISNQGSDTRRLCVTTLAIAFGVERAAMKRWLRAKGLCGERD